MATRFDASTDSYSRTFSLGNLANYTFGGWARIDVDRNNFSAFWDWGAAGLGILTDADGTTMKVWDDTAGAFVATGPNMVVGTWYYLAVSVSGTSATFYWRAASDTSFSSATWTGATRNFDAAKIGNDNFDEWLNGSVQNLKLWDAGLSSAELFAESLYHVPFRIVNLKAWYVLLGTELVDFSGNGQTLTAGSTSTARADGPPISWRASATKDVEPVSSIPTISVPLLSAPSILFSPSVTVGPVNVQVPLLSVPSTLFQPELEHVVQIPVINAPTALFNPSITLSAISIQVPLLSVPSTIFSPSVSRSEVLVPLLSVSSTLFNPSVTGGETPPPSLGVPSYYPYRRRY